MKALLNKIVNKKNSEKQKLVYEKGFLVKLLRQNKVADKISNESVISLSVVLEYLTEEILFLVLGKVESLKMKRINIYGIEMAFKEDSELRQFFGGRKLNFRNQNLPKEDLEIVNEEENEEGSQERINQVNDN